MGDDYISLKPFVGGAEKARRNARKRMYQPKRSDSSSNNKRRHNNNNQTIIHYPKSMREYERYFGSLLSSPTNAIHKSETDGRLHSQVMQQACTLLNVPALPPPPYLQQKLASKSNDDARTHHLLQGSTSLLGTASSSTASSSSSSGTFDNARSYYMSKAPLILEESRCIIATSLSQVYKSNNINNRKQKRNGNSNGFTLQLTSIEEKYPKITNSRQRQYAPLILNFEIITNKNDCGSNEIKSKWSRPGSVLLLQQQTSSVLACIVPNGNHQTTSANVLSLMIFRRDDVDLSEFNNDDDDQTNCSTEKKLIFHATAVTTLIGQVRQIEACLRMVKVSFMHKLLGQKSSTHIRFDNSSSSSEDEEEEVVGELSDNREDTIQEGYYVKEDGDEYTSDEDREEDVEDNSRNNMSSLLTRIPTLNQTQERAAKRFLDSPKESLILVQGPPGTGKSTFLVNVICRRLVSNPTARILVTAPTNKAVTVLAERFLKVISCGETPFCSCVLIGVEDKLIDTSTEHVSSDVLTSSLRSIFVYSWVDTVKDECISLLSSIKELQTSNNTECNIDTLIANAERIKAKIVISIPSISSVCRSAKLLVQELKEESLENAIIQIKVLVEALDDMDSPVSELLATARVIFCTLSTAGSSIIKQTRRIDDLLVDEAACATEAEICIPFHLRPKRMLAVGDPLQLPPTIMSRHAADMGLSTSMHERLMNQCSEEYVMLDKQYRMRPCISTFPCKQFYDGMISNGDNVSSISYTSDIALPKLGAYSFINVRGSESQMSTGSYCNEAECDVVASLIKQIAARQIDNWHHSDKLRIITFYQGQVTLLRRLLAKEGYSRVLVATVDSSQGCEADVVIISFVRSSSKKGKHAAGFLCDDRRVNVALTRARHQLICVGDAQETLSKQGSATLGSLVSDAQNRGSLI